MPVASGQLSLMEAAMNELTEISKPKGVSSTTLKSLCNLFVKLREELDLQQIVQVLDYFVLCINKATVTTSLEKDVGRCFGYVLQLVAYVLSAKSSNQLNEGCLNSLANVCRYLFNDSIFRYIRNGMPAPEMDKLLQYTHNVLQYALGSKLSMLNTIDLVLYRTIIVKESLSSDETSSQSTKLIENCLLLLNNIRAQLQQLSNSPKKSDSSTFRVSVLLLQQVLNSYYEFVNQQKGSNGKQINQVLAQGMIVVVVSELELSASLSEWNDRGSVEQYCFISLLKHLRQLHRQQEVLLVNMELILLILNVMRCRYSMLHTSIPEASNNNNKSTALLVGSSTKTNNSISSSGMANCLVQYCTEIISMYDILNQENVVKQISYFRTIAAVLSTIPVELLTLSDENPSVSILSALALSVRGIIRNYLDSSVSPSCMNGKVDESDTLVNSPQDPLLWQALLSICTTLYPKYVKLKLYSDGISLQCYSVCLLVRMKEFSDDRLVNSSETKGAVKSKSSAITEMKEGSESVPFNEEEALCKILQSLRCNICLICNENSKSSGTTALDYQPILSSLCTVLNNCMDCKWVAALVIHCMDHLLENGNIMRPLDNLLPIKNNLDGIMFDMIVYCRKDQSSSKDDVLNQLLSKLSSQVEQSCKQHLQQNKICQSICKFQLKLQLAEGNHDKLVKDGYFDTFKSGITSLLSTNAPVGNEEETDSNSNYNESIGSDNAENDTSVSFPMTNIQQKEYQQLYSQITNIIENFQQLVQSLKLCVGISDSSSSHKIDQLDMKTFIWLCSMLDCFVIKDIQRLCNMCKILQMCHEEYKLMKLLRELCYTVVDRIHIMNTANMSPIVQQNQKLFQIYGFGYRIQDISISQLISYNFQISAWNFTAVQEESDTFALLDILSLVKSSCGTATDCSVVNSTTVTIFQKVCEIGAIIQLDFNNCHKQIIEIQRKLFDNSNATSSSKINNNSSKDKKTPLIVTQLLGQSTGKSSITIAAYESVINDIDVALQCWKQHKSFHIYGLWKMLQIWVGLAFVKHMLMIQSAHKDALVLSKQVLSNVLTFENFYHSKMMKNSNNELNCRKQIEEHIGDCKVDLDISSLFSIKLELLMMIATIHEQTGNITHAMSYAMESTALCANNRQYYSNSQTVTILCVYLSRILYRITSDKRLRCCMKVLEMVSSLSNNRQQFTDLIVWTGLTSNSASNSNKSEKSKDLSKMKWNNYHYDLMWDTIGRYILENRCDSDAGSDFMLFDTCMNRDIRECLAFIRKSQGTDLGTGIHSSASQILNSAVNTGDFSNLAFDVSSFLRRRLACDCYQAKEKCDVTRGILSPAFKSFLLSASSCNISLETNLDIQLANKNSVEKLNEKRKTCEKSSMTDCLKNSGLLLQGYCNSMTANRQTSTVINQLLSIICTDSHSILCCMSIDYSLGKLIIGRYQPAVCDSCSPYCFVVALDINDELHRILNNWENVMKESKEQLAQTRSIENIRKWTEKDKKIWWNKRYKTDEDIAKIAMELQEWFGLWICLLQSYRNSDIDIMKMEDQSLSLLQIIHKKTYHSQFNDSVNDNKVHKTMAQSTIFDRFNILITEQQREELSRIAENIAMCLRDSSNSSSSSVKGTHKNDGSSSQDILNILISFVIPWLDIFSNHNTKSSSISEYLLDNEAMIAAAFLKLVEQLPFYMRIASSHIVVFNKQFKLFLTKIIHVVLDRIVIVNPSSSILDPRNGIGGSPGSKSPVNNILDAFHDEADDDTDNISHSIGTLSFADKDSEENQLNISIIESECELKSEQQSDVVDGSSSNGTIITAAGNKPDYESMKVVELTKLCKQYGLPVAGKKSELIQRLHCRLEESCVTSSKKVVNNVRESLVNKEQAKQLQQAKDENIFKLSRSTVTPMKKPTANIIKTDNSILTAATPNKQAAVAQTPVPNQSNVFGTTPFTIKKTTVNMSLSAMKTPGAMRLPPNTTTKKKSTAVSIFTEEDDSDDDRDIDSNKITSNCNKKDNNRYDEVNSAVNTHTQSKVNAMRKGHVLMILDENIQCAFPPIESLPVLQYTSISRVPGLCMLLAMVMYRMSKDNYLAIEQAVHSVENDKAQVELKLRPSTGSVDIRKSWYVIDPENNLSNTHEGMSKTVATPAKRYGWTGYVGKIPTEDEFRQHHESSDIYMFCGHGWGSCILKDSNSIKKYRSAPAALLWGCSSGVLSRHGVHDPNGAVLSYLCAGAPFAVGNLWDVTEKDLDKISEDYMTKILAMGSSAEDAIHQRNNQISNCNNSNNNNKENIGSMCDDKSLGNILAYSRKTCKLVNAVGTAVVMYGVPLPMLITNNE